jgi:hypothetical protein
MSRSTKADKARQLNAAYRLLQRGRELSEAAQALSGEWGLSRRQAYRYLEQAAALERPVPVAEASVPVTLKIPGEHPACASRVCEAERAHAWRDHHARAFRVSRRVAHAWLSGGHDAAHFKSTSAMSLTACARTSSPRRTRFWRPTGHAHSGRA